MTAMSALSRANEYKRKRFELRQALTGAGIGHAEPMIAEMLRKFDDQPEWFKTTRLLVLLTAIPRIKDSKAFKFLARCNIYSDRRLEEMTQRQRLVIADNISHIHSKGYYSFDPLKR